VIGTREGSAIGIPKGNEPWFEQPYFFTFVALSALLFIDSRNR
jgi:hypothetical protein